LQSMKAAAISEKGPRPTMEDFYFLDVDFGGNGWIYGGIYDGHGGDYAARYAAENLHLLFLEKILSGESPFQAFSESYEEIAGRISRQDSGTTAVDFFIKDGWIYVANVGDAEAIVLTDDNYIELSTLHRLDNQKERERVLRSGAMIEYPYVVRGNRGLMPTRVLGDAYFRVVGVIPTPAAQKHKIEDKDLYLIAATDGLWDVAGKNEVASFARNYPEIEKLLEALKREALINRLGSDNLTVIAVNLRGD